MMMTMAQEARRSGTTPASFSLTRAPTCQNCGFKGNNIMSQLVGSSVTDTEFHSVGISDDDDEDDPDIHDDDDDDDDNRPVRL